MFLPVPSSRFSLNPSFPPPPVSPVDFLSWWRCSFWLLWVCAFIVKGDQSWWDGRHRQQQTTGSHSYFCTYFDVLVKKHLRTVKWKQSRGCTYSHLYLLVSTDYFSIFLIWWVEGLKNARLIYYRWRTKRLRSPPASVCCCSHFCYNKKGILFYFF